MLIKFILNREPVSIEVPAYKRLSDVLREDYNLTGLRSACEKGFCGLCTVVLEGELVYSCMIPVFQIRGKSVLTIEGYATEEGFNDIFQGFKEAGVHLCDYCAPTRTLTTGILLDKYIRPDEKQLNEIVTSVKCNCTPYETLKQGILRSTEIRQRREKQ
jgi:carbon-monoxide dehydrogenase small subunit